MTLETEHKSILLVQLQLTISYFPGDMYLVIPNSCRAQKKSNNNNKLQFPSCWKSWLSKTIENRYKVGQKPTANCCSEFQKRNVGKAEYSRTSASLQPGHFQRLSQVILLHVLWLIFAFHSKPEEGYRTKTGFG